VDNEVDSPAPWRLVRREATAGLAEHVAALILAGDHDGADRLSAVVRVVARSRGHYGSLEQAAIAEHRVFYDPRELARAFGLP
jgi:hypothetical protein